MLEERCSSCVPFLIPNFMITNPYAADLGAREPVPAMRDATQQMRSLMSAWTPAQFERTYAPGKWTARQILTHLAQSEMMFGARARLALTTPEYVAQSMEQDLWMAREVGLSGRDAANAYVTLSRMNAALFAA